MEEKQRVDGRGAKLLQKIRLRTVGQPADVSAAEELKPDVGVSKSDSQKPKGRAQLLTQLKSLSPKSIDTSKEVGVSRETKPADQKGRGFLAELAKQQKVVDVSGPGQLPVLGLRKSALESTAEKIKELSLDSAEIDKPKVVKRGQVGEKVDVTVNYISLKTDQGKGVFLYDVRFTPQIDYIAFRYQLISQHFKKKKGIRCYDGGDQLFVPEKFQSDKTIIDAKHPNDESPVQITLTFKREMRPKECSQLYNILFNNCSKALKLARLGKEHYDYKLSRQVPQHKLEIWPGFVTSVEEYEGGIHFRCDIRHRVLRTETAYDVIYALTKCDPLNYKSLVLKELLGQCVLTRYNNNLYRIDDIDWNKTPMNTFKLSSGKDISFLEYYKTQYNLQIVDLKQPILISKKKSNRNEEGLQLICLIPELCNLTGISDRMRKDMKVMKDIAMYTRVTPAQRLYGFKKFIENLKNNELAQEMLNDWGLKLDDDFLKLDARVLPQENIILKNKTSFPVPSNCEWSKYFQNGVYRDISLRHWLLIHTKRDWKLVNSFWAMLLKVGPGLGIDIHDPVFIPLGDDKIDSYVTAVRENMTPNIQIILFICPTLRCDRYSAIKKLCCREIPVPSQIVQASTISRENRLRAVVQNVALQINNKIGGASWAVHIPLKNTMLCGIDSYHETDGKGSSVGAFVASLDSAFTQWYSKICIQEPRQELVDGLVCCFSFSLKKYLEINSQLPERIVIFRDGVSDGQLPLVQKYEIMQFLDVCESIYNNYKPKFLFIVVQKRISTKFFRVSNDGPENPKAGSVLDHTVTSRNYFDFYLVPQHVNCGTATPSHYIVLYDTSELTPDHIQRLTYKCCHIYYNWAGTIRVPAPCQYAHKLAYLVGQNVRDFPKNILDDKLYYL